VVRRRHQPEAREVLAVTGAASGLGKALVERLSRRLDLGGLVGVDTVPGRVDGVVWRTVEVRDTALSQRLTGVTTVVHLATSYDLAQPAAARRSLNLEGTARVLEAAAELSLRRVVLCTSAEVYGARPDNPVPLPDAWPLRSEVEPGSLAEDHLRVEDLAEQARRSGLDVTVLRPAPLVGLPEEYVAPLLRQLAGPRLLAVRGLEPLWQLCHVEDLVSALELAAMGGASGGFAVGCEGSLPQRLVEQLSRKGRLELPASVAVSTAQRMHRLGVMTSSPRELDHVLGQLVVAADGLRAAGWAPSWTNEQALQAHLAAQGTESRTVAYSAAGATVALLGTAALVRQARRRRRV
jgi:nucleoside-diphosphate-sugar epimerase